MLEYPPTGKDASRLGRVRQSGEEKGKAFCLIILKLVEKKSNQPQIISMGMSMSLPPSAPDHL
jgi:hypothetical protein